MQRREFIQRSASFAVATAPALALNPADVLANTPSFRLPLPASRFPLPAPSPISETERLERRDKAQRLMKQLGYSAMLIEPGANMTYFAGIEWGRSERLFAFILPVAGKAIVIAPAFEQQRAED